MTVEVDCHLSTSVLGLRHVVLVLTNLEFRLESRVFKTGLDRVIE